MRITVTLYRIVPRHLILQRVVPISESFPSQNQVNYKTFMPLLGKSKRALFERNSDRGEWSCCSSSEDDQSVSEICLFT